MDSDLSDISAADRPQSTLWWPGLWVPALILITGIGISLVTARVVSDSVQHLAQRHYQAMHQSLVKEIIIYLRSSSAQNSNNQSLEVALAGALGDDLGLRIDTLEQHSKMPMLQLGNTDTAADHHTLRTELKTDDQHWMVTTVPSHRLLEVPSRRAHWLVMAGGIMITAVSILLALALCRQNHQKTRTIELLQEKNLANNQQLTNLQVEKTVLRQALNDSESRSRDLVALSGAIMGELDEGGHIGFLSAQTADYLGHAPSDLVDQPFTTLMTEPDRQRFDHYLEAARREQTLARIDVNMLHRTTERVVPMVVRVIALTNPLHGVTGFRLSAVPVYKG